MRQQRKVGLCLFVFLIGVAVAGYMLAPAAESFLYPAPLLAETRSGANLGTADFLVETGSFARHKTYFFVRDPAISAGQPVCSGGPYAADGPLQMQEAVWSKDGSVIAVRVKAEASAGHDLREGEAALWIDAYDFRKHHSVVEGNKLEARSQAIARLLRARGGASAKTLSSPKIVGKPLKASERHIYDTVEEDYRPLYNSNEGGKN